MKSGLYEKYYLNFISPISRHLLEDLATSSLQYDCVDVVTKVMSLFYKSVIFDCIVVKQN